MIKAFLGMITALITLALLALPGLCLTWLLIRIAKKHIKPKSSVKQKLHNNKYNTQYQTGWTWNEAKKIWEPPAGVKRKEDQDLKQTNEQEEKSEELNYKNAYQAKQLFTKNEWQSYKKLKEIAEIKGYVICPKVRLLDIIEPKKGITNYMSYLGKIKSKHVDFVICDKDMRIKAIIELDDNSHNRPDRKERDDFVDAILQSVNYKIIHTRYIENSILDLV